MNQPSVRLRKLLAVNVFSPQVVNIARTETILRTYEIIKNTVPTISTAALDICPRFPRNKYDIKMPSSTSVKKAMTALIAKVPVSIGGAK
jgi:hypothetical protein